MNYSTFRTRTLANSATRKSPPSSLVTERYLEDVRAAETMWLFQSNWAHDTPDALKAGDNWNGHMAVHAFVVGRIADEDTDDGPRRWDHAEYSSIPGCI